MHFLCVERNCCVQQNKTAAVANGGFRSTMQRSSARPQNFDEHSPRRTSEDRKQDSSSAVILGVSRLCTAVALDGHLKMFVGQPTNVLGISESSGSHPR